MHSLITLRPLAPVLLKNGSLVGIWRTWGDKSCGFGGSCPHLVTARNWRDPATYTFHKELLFAAQGMTTDGTEDPALYLDSKGRFHALFHNMYTPKLPLSPTCLPSKTHWLSKARSDTSVTNNIHLRPDQYAKGSQRLFLTTSKSNENQNLRFTK